MLIYKSLIFGITILAAVITGGCCSGKNSTGEVSRTDFLSRNSKVSLAPGTADIMAHVLSLTESNTGVNCRLRVKQVKEYGAATPQLPPDSEIEIQIPKSVIDNEKINEGNDILLRVSYYHTPMDENNYWAFVKFN